MTAADIDAIERAAQEALPREDLCGLCGCEDEPYFPKKWEGRNAVNCVRASRLKVQIAYIAAANPAAILSLIAEVHELTRQRDEARAALEVFRPKERPEEPPTLKGFGYAPGGYMVKCIDCGDHPIGLDKRAWRCLQCAQKRLDAALSALPPPASATEGAP